MDELKGDLKQIGKYLLTLAGEVTGTRADLKRLETRFETMEETVQKIRGTFASIEQHLVTLFEFDAEMRKQWQDLTRRVEALEKRTPPAA